VATFSLGRRIWCWLTGALLIAAAPLVLAGPGFIGSSRVSGDASGADIEVTFNCKAQYLRHEPQGRGDHVRIYLEPTGICNGVSPLVANSRALMRPINSDMAHLSDLEYDGESAAGSVLTLSFSEPVDYTVAMSDISFELVVHVRPASTQTTPAIERPAVAHRRVAQEIVETPDYAINLASFRRIPTVADAPGLVPAANQKTYYIESNVGGVTWYRLRLGNFNSEDEASAALTEVVANIPDAWIDQVDVNDIAVELSVDAIDETALFSSLGEDATKVDLLMEEARQMLVAGERSRAIQIYTKILQMPENSRQPEAQEYLALAREKNGQIAHAKAEYQRYLSEYPEGDGAARVSQRLAALLAIGRQASSASNGQGIGKVAKQSDWRMHTFFSQYYRRDANQQNDQDEIISQSALYSDVNFDARRRGERFDFSSRISAGYRSDFLDENVGSGNGSRISYAYADLADAKTGWRGRLGRQSRNSGGVLGRFDGLNVGYQASERLLLNAVVGKPAYSASNGVDPSRSFFGTSLNFGPILENLDLGLFYIDQEIEGIQDRASGAWSTTTPCTTNWAVLSCKVVGASPRDYRYTDRLTGGIVHFSASATLSSASRSWTSRNCSRYGRSKTFVSLASTAAQFPRHSQLDCLIRSQRSGRSMPMRASQLLRKLRLPEVFYRLRAQATATTRPVSLPVACSKKAM